MSDSDSDHDILVRLDQRVLDIHRDMTQPEGRVPKLEGRVSSHDAALNQIFGGMTAAKWIVGGIGAAVLGIGIALITHLLGGK